MTEKLKIERSSGNVYQYPGFAPDEAHNLQLRSELMSRIERHVKRSGLPQIKAALAPGITQPRLNDLLFHLYFNSEVIFHSNTVDRTL